MLAAVKEGQFEVLLTSYDIFRWVFFVEGGFILFNFFQSFNSMMLFFR